MTFEDALKECYDILKNQKEVIWFLRAKEAIKNNKEIQELERKMHYYQRQMTLNYDNNEVYQKSRQEFLLLQKQYEEHPLIQNYKVLQEQVYDLLLQMKIILEK